MSDQVRNGEVILGKVRRQQVRLALFRLGIVWFSLCSMVWYGVVWCDMYGMVWCGVVSYGMVWYGMV